MLFIGDLFKGDDEWIIVGFGDIEMFNIVGKVLSLIIGLFLVVWFWFMLFWFILFFLFISFFFVLFLVVKLEE